MRQCKQCLTPLDLKDPETVVRDNGSSHDCFCDSDCSELYDKRHPKTEPPVNRTMALAVGVLVALALLAWAVVPARGEWNGEASETERAYFNALTAPNGASCCSISDCGYIENEDWRIKDGRYEVFIESAWTPVPPERVLDRNKSPQGKPVLCRRGTTIYCFAPDVLT